MCLKNRAQIEPNFGQDACVNLAECEKSGKGLVLDKLDF